MKLLTFKIEGKERVGILSEDEKTVFGTDHSDMNELICSGASPQKTGEEFALEDVELAAPIPRPRQDVICLGINYAAHAKESARYKKESFEKNREYTIYFSKRVN